MNTSWQEYINDFKCLAHSDPRQLLRISLSEEELDHFWDTCPFVLMEQLFLLCSDTLVAFLYSQLLPSYLSSRKLNDEAYSVSSLDANRHEQCLMYVYDCKLFRSSIFTREENDFISLFMLVYREDIPVKEKVIDIVDANRLPAGRWVLKVKEGGLLRVHAYIKEFMKRLRHREDKVVMGVDRYDSFMEEWLKIYGNYSLEVATGYFFRGVLILLENQLLLAYARTLSPNQIAQRVYAKPIRCIEKPKNVEQFTLTEGATWTETKWQTLKVTAFKLKYRVVEEPHVYYCYLLPESEEAEFDPQDFSEEDKLIIDAFSQLRKIEASYYQYM